MKHKLIMENWRKFKNLQESQALTPDELSQLPELEPEEESSIITMVHDFLRAQYNYVMSDGPLEDDELAKVIVAKNKLGELEGDSKKFANNLLAINIERFGDKAGGPANAMQKDPSRKPGTDIMPDIDVDDPSNYA